jgi:predicted ATPase/Tfp pilus assembly protein PilF
VSAVALGLDVPLGIEDPVTQIGNAIAGHDDCLLILDNFEQVARYAEGTLGRWLDRAKNARFVVTTREVLGLVGEQIMALPPLSVADAMTLFSRRAHAAKHGFEWTLEQRNAVDPLVRLLDCLPLAIELCAARVRLMPPTQLLHRMGERFQLLRSAGGRQDRQATLRAALDWSWDLLTPVEKGALSQLSVFDGGFRLEAAEAVVDISRFPDSGWTTDVIQSLVDKSFVVNDKGRRFGLLVSVREYAAERLHQEGPLAARAAQLRHCQYFAGLSEAAATEESCADLGNLIAASRASAQFRDAQLAARALIGAWSGLKLRGPYRLAVELAMQVRDLHPADTITGAWVQWVEASALRAIGRSEDAETLLTAAQVEARQADDKDCQTRVLIGLGEICIATGRMPLARRHLQAALELARDSGYRILEGEALSSLGSLCDFQGEVQDAGRYYEESLKVARSVNNRRGESGVLGNLGTWYANQGKWSLARERFQQSLDGAIAVGDRRWENNALCNLGLLHHMEGDLEPARVKLLSALQGAREVGSEHLECIALGNLGLVDSQAGRIDHAQTHYEEAIQVAHRIGDRRAEGQFYGYLGLLQGKQGQLNNARQNLDTGETMLEGLQDRVSLALLFAQRAEVEWLAQDLRAACEARDKAQTSMLELGFPPESEFGMQLRRLNDLFGDSEDA